MQGLLGQGKGLDLTISKANSIIGFPHPLCEIAHFKQSGVQTLPFVYSPMMTLS